MRDVPGGRELLNVVVCGKSDFTTSLPKHLQPLDKDPTKTMKVCCCNEFRDNIFDQFSDLRLLAMTQINLTRFDLSFIANNPRLETLILDNNPIEELVSDAQISLETLSLNNTMLKSIPNTTLHIMRRLKHLYITGDYIDSSKNVRVCKELSSLESYNGEYCRENVKSRSQSGETLRGSSGNSSSFSTRLLPAFRNTLLIILLGFRI